MSSKQTPASKPATAEKKARKPKAPGMSIKTKFDVMTLINGADPKSPDATLAARLSVTHGRPISAQQVGKYRKELGLASVGKPPHADLVNDLAAANARIAALEAAAAGQCGDAETNKPAGLTG